MVNSGVVAEEPDISVGDDIVLTLVWIAVLLVVFAPLSVRLYRKVK